MSEINYQSVQEYLSSLVPPREPELQKMEEYAEKNDFPIIGPVCGKHRVRLILSSTILIKRAILIRFRSPKKNYDMVEF